MNATPRMKQIFQILLKEREAVPVKLLAEKIGVSKRTVQRELEYVASALRGYEISFKSKTGVGVWLEGADAEKERLLLAVSEGDDYDASNREERRKRLLLEILREKGLKKLFYYSDRFGVSEATVSVDLEAVGEWLRNYGLVVRRRPGSGISVEGSEEDYRRAIRAFVEESLSTEAVSVSGEKKSGGAVLGKGLKESGFMQLLDRDIVERVTDCIAKINDTRVLTLTESSYNGLVIHISIAMNRILKNEVIEPKQSIKEHLEKDGDYRLAEEIVKRLEEEFETEIPEVEVGYICLHIMGAKHEKILWDQSRSIAVENRRLQQLLNEMIDAFDEKQAYFLKQDDEFIQGLLAHLQPTLIRLVHGMQIQNPILRDIQKSYPEIYAGCERVAAVLEKTVKKKVPEEEIGFLTVHFGAALTRLEKRKEKRRKVRVGVVCSSGIGLSRLMASGLENAFGGRLILTACGKSDITPYMIGRVDFFVTSISLGDVGVPVIDVNPLLNEEDMQKIRQMVYKYERMPEKNEEDKKFSIQLEEIHLVITQINTVINGMDLFRVSENITFDELLLFAAERLSDSPAHSEMIREDIWRRERIATQIFAELGFALLHTRTEGVATPCFLVCITKEADRFLNPYLKGIRVIFFMLVPIDNMLSVNSEIMGYISSMLVEEPEFLDIAAGGNKEEIHGFLSNSLKEYFKKYLSDLS